MTSNDPYADFKCIQAQSPDAWTAAADTSAAIVTTGYRTATIILNAGTLGTSATLDCKVTGTATSGGVHADISGAAFTQRVKATDDDTVVIGRVNLKGYAEIKTIMTVGTATSDAGCSVILSNAKTSSTANVEWKV